MFEIIFFEDDQGNQPIKEYLDNLEKKLDKHSRINYDKIRYHIYNLKKCGLALKYPMIRHICGDIWELRPLKNRIFFFCWHEKNFVLLHFFIKKTQKTPKIEIKRAQDNLQIFLERSQKNVK